jgi:hypothetical protein
MKKIFLILCTNLFIVGGLLAQDNFEYTYDANGNRVVRQIITLMQISEDADNTIQGENTIVYSQDNTKIYPNPVSVSLTIDVVNSNENGFDYNLIDLQGRQVKNGHADSGSTNLLC